MTPELIALAKQTALAHAIDPVLVCAVVEQESNWVPQAIRYEDAFYQRYIMKLNLHDATEARARAFSWGLMQVMGEVAREEGFVGHLVDLCQPAIGLDRGCVHLAKKLFVHPEVESALLAWNGGGNIRYGQQVLARMEKYR